MEKRWVDLLIVKVVGLTASVGVGKAGNQEQARKHIRKLCAHLDTDFIRTVARNTEQLAQFSNDPKYGMSCMKLLYSATPPFYAKQLAQFSNYLKYGMSCTKLLYSEPHFSTPNSWTISLMSPSMLCHA